MKRTSRIIVASLAAAALVFAVVHATGGGSSRDAARPVRALGAGENADPDLAVGSGGAPAVPVAGMAAVPNHTRPLTKLTNRPPTRVPWVKRELDVEAEQAAAEAAGTEAEATKPAFERSADLGQADAALQTDRGSSQFPAPSLSFKGLGANANPFQLVPPDTNGDVGNGYYLQMVNVAFAIYDAGTGAKLVGPLNMSTLFDTGTQKLCATHDDGDPVVVYDEYADRFVITQFGLNFNSAKFAECIAVSATSDPTGSWNAYQFDYPKSGLLNDYPKFGVWPAANNNAYMATFNQFRCTTGTCDLAWRGGAAIAYDRAAMIAGTTAGQEYFDLYGVDPNLAMIPADADGATPPSASTPGYFAQFDADEWGYPDDALEIYEFDVNWGGTSTFTAQNTDITTANFSPWICGTGKTYCIPQKGSKNKLDALNDRLMFRLQYRNMGGGDERMVVTHSVRASKGQAGLRWYELNDAGSGWGIANQGTYSPDTAKSRWMGSAAMDSAGNIAIGYSLSSGKIFPSIGVVGRNSTAPANTLDLGERKVFTGLGSEKGNYGRWGDYSDMTVAEDGCTFYYTTEYYKKTGQWKWATQILRFTIPSC